MTGRAELRGGQWRPEGGPLDAAIAALAHRSGWTEDLHQVIHRLPYTADRMMSSALADGWLTTLGAPESVFSRCTDVPVSAHRELARMTAAGQRVLAVGGRPWTAADASAQ